MILGQGCFQSHDVVTSTTSETEDLRQEKELLQATEPLSKTGANRISSDEFFVKVKWIDYFDFSTLSVFLRDRASLCCNS